MNGSTAKPISVVLASDDRFSRPLAVAVRSIVANLSADRALNLYLCDMGISPQNREMVDAVARDPRVQVEWITTLKEKVEHLPRATWPGITAAAYARLYIPSVLPAHTDQALYLDCDLIARRCVGELFDTPIGGYAAMGVADAASPFVASPYGVPFWVRYGRRTDEVNFNSGVLLMNLAKWRDDDLAGAALAYLTDGRHKQLVDQEAINAVLPGQIGEIDPRWNQQTEHFIPKFQYTLPYSEQQLTDVLKDPWIVHFTTNVKAWSYQCTHPFRGEWFKYLDQTPFRGWRPNRAQYLAKSAGNLLRVVKSRLAVSST